MKENLYDEIADLGKRIYRFRKMMEKEYNCKSKYELSISKRLESNILWVQLECMEDLMEVLVTRAKIAGINLPLLDEFTEE